MNVAGIVRDLFLHMEWADATVWRAVRTLRSDDKKLRARKYHREAIDFVKNVDEQHLDRELVLPWARHFAEGPRATTLGETMIQITSHSTYHRGQINMRMRELGGDPPLVDFIAWLWQGRPVARWS